MENWFKLRGFITSKVSFFLEIGGFLLVLLIWHLLTVGDKPILKPVLFPSPWKVLQAWSTLAKEYELVRNLCRSLGLNIGAYIEAIAISIPLGFVIGLFPFFKGLLSKQIDALRFVPLTAVTLIFITWFGLGTAMKLHFLAFGILIYLLPIVVQRIQELDDIYVKTVYTLGANTWQTIKTVFIPGVASRLSDDIRVLTAISWTYIIFIEMMGNQGGIGALIWRVGQRQQRIDILFALVLVIIVLGILQDKLFIRMDKTLFPHKYQHLEQIKNKTKDSLARKMKFWLSRIFLYFMVFVVMFYLVLVLDEYFGIAGGIDLLSYLFEDTLWAIHVVVALWIIYQIRHMFESKDYQNPSLT